MTESGILAEGSVRGILNGTHYNRCKKLHVVAALSLKILHFQAFLRKYNENNDDESKLYVNEIIEILEDDNRNSSNIDETLRLLNKLLQEYNVYVKETRQGEHGLTPQFVALYVWFVELFQLLEYAIRSSDLELYIYSIQNVQHTYVQHTNVRIKRKSS